MKHTVRFLIFLLLLTVAVPSKADVIKVDDARKTAMRFLGTGTRVSEAITVSKDGNAALYVFNCKQGGYVIVSADDRTDRKILGWSDKGLFDSNESSPLNDLIEGYATGIASMRKANAVMPTATRSGVFPESVDPLLGDIEWHQQYPYSKMCPTYTEDGVNYYNYLAGCSAAALAQVMMYHRWPAQGHGSYSYESNGQTYYADFSKSVYRWDMMLSTYKNGYTDEQADAVALLMHDVAISLRTTFSLAGSFAGFQYPNIVNFFDYDRNMKYAEGAHCTQEDWENILYSELSQGRPVLCTGNSANGSGHAFVCDGYNNEGLFHYNFGWEGTGNGWFASSATGFDVASTLSYGIQKNCGGTGAPSLHSRDDFKWVHDNVLSADLQVWVIGYESSDSATVELGLALQNTVSGEVTYYLKDSQKWNSWIWKEVTFDEIVADGTYKVYPVGRMAGEEEWHRFFHNSQRQIEVDLNVTDGVKVWANNGLVDPIDEGVVELNGFYYMFDEDKQEATVTRRNTKGNCYSGDVIIPDYVTFEGTTYTVSKIGTCAFEYSTDMHSVTVGANVTEIEMGAFGFAGITSITFAEGSRLETLGGWAFNACQGLEEIVLPSGIMYVNRNAFQSCFNLKNVVIPSSVYSFGSDCFVGCTALKTIHVQWTSLKNVYWYDDFAEDGLGSDLIIYVPVGYTGTYDCSPWNCCRILEEGTEPEPQPVEDKAIYVVWGSGGIMNTSVAQATLKLDSDGCYSGDVNVPDNGWDGTYEIFFCMTLSDSYSTFRADCLGAPSYGYEVADGVTCSLTKGSDNSFIIDAGIHHIVVDLKSLTISFASTSGVKTVSITEDDVMYDLTGRIVTNPVPGQFLIRNGRKFLYK